MSQKFFNTTVPIDLNFSKSEAFVNSNDLSKKLNRAIKNSEELFFSPAPKASEILTTIERYRNKL